MSARIAIVYYSATGVVHALASGVAEGATEAGAEVRLRRVPETVPVEVIATNPNWQAHAEGDAQGIAIATVEDMEWANGYALGTPTRFGNVSSQLKSFIDSLGGFWYTGGLSNKAATTFASASNTHGGNESTTISMWNVLAHWGCVIVPPGYTDPALFAAGGNPYGTAWTSGQDSTKPDAAALQAARIQGARLARVAAALDGSL